MEEQQDELSYQICQLMSASIIGGTNERYKNLRENMSKSFYIDRFLPILNRINCGCNNKEHQERYK